MKHLQSITVLVLGLGESGLAMARWCAHFGADVRVWDSRESPDHAGAAACGPPRHGVSGSPQAQHENGLIL